MYLAQGPFKGTPSDGAESGNAIHRVVTRRAMRSSLSEKGSAKDDKDTKGTARMMMRMMFVINKENFDGHT
jgi:hypothetical protein